MAHVPGLWTSLLDFTVMVLIEGSSPVTGEVLYPVRQWDTAAEAHWPLRLPCHPHPPDQ
jgi:hypothetical protein